MRPTGFSPKMWKHLAITNAVASQSKRRPMLTLTISPEKLSTKTLKQTWQTNHCHAPEEFFSTQ